MASLLATGVISLTTLFLKEGFFTGSAGLGIELTPLAWELAFKTPVDGAGVPLAAFLEKKLSIEPFFELAELGCRFKDGVVDAVGVSEVSFFTIVVYTGSWGKEK